MYASSQLDGRGPRFETLCARSSDFFLAGGGGKSSSKGTGDDFADEASTLLLFLRLLPSEDGWAPGTSVPAEFVLLTWLLRGSFGGFGVP